MGYPEITKKLDTLREYLEDLRPYIALETDVILTNKEKLFTLERLFQLVVDEAADINASLSYLITHTVPESYRSSFAALVGAGALEAGFSEKIATSAKVRNQIVHDYEKLQKRETIEAVKTFFPLYEQYLATLIDKVSKERTP